MQITLVVGVFMTFTVCGLRFPSERGQCTLNAYSIHICCKWVECGLMCVKRPEVSVIRLSYHSV